MFRQFVFQVLWISGRARRIEVPKIPKGNPKQRRDHNKSQAKSQAKREFCRETNKSQAKREFCRETNILA